MVAATTGVGASEGHRAKSGVANLPGNAFESQVATLATPGGAARMPRN